MTVTPRSGTLRTLLGGNVLWLSMVSLLNDTASEMIYPLLPLFLLNVLGASHVALGGIEGAAESASSLLKLASGWISDRFRRRKPLVIAGYGIAAVVRPLIAVVSAAWQIMPIRLADRVGKGIRGAPRDALLVESVPVSMRGRAFGIHRAADHAGAVLGPLLGFVLLGVIAGNFRPVFALAIIPGVISVIVLIFFVHERGMTAQDARAQPGAGQPGVEAAAHREQNPDDHGRVMHGTFARFLLVLIIFTLGNASDAFLIVRADDLGIPLGVVPLLWGVHHVSKMVWSVPGGSLADRFGPRPAIIAGWAVYALIYAGFAFASEAWHIWALFVGYGLFYGLTEAPEKAMVAALAPARRRGSAFGAYHAAIGIAALPASVIFGAIWSRWGAQAAFLTGAITALVASLLLASMVRPSMISHTAAET
jgi:MFS family permease